MKLVEAASLLGNIQIQNVRFGALVIARVNASLPARFHLSGECTGDDLLKDFRGMDFDSKKTIDSVVVLSDNELHAFIADITKLREKNKTNEVDIDANWFWFTSACMAGSLVIGLFAILILVFNVMDNQDTFHGTVYIGFMDVVHFIQNHWMAPTVPKKE